MKISSSYVYGNTHYNQMQSVPVTPVKPVRRTPELVGQEDRAKIAVTYSPDGSDEKAQKLQNSKQTDEIMQEYADKQQASYNQSNPYEQARMMTEGSVIVGMNFDMFA